MTLKFLKPKICKHHPPSPITHLRLWTSESDSKVAAVVSEWSEKAWLLDELSEDGRKQLLKDLHQASTKSPKKVVLGFQKMKRVNVEKTTPLTF